MEIDELEAKVKQLEIEKLSAQRDAVRWEIAFHQVSITHGETRLPMLEGAFRAINAKLEAAK